MPRETTRGRTADRGPPGARRAPVYTVGQIGPKRKLRPDGSLLCEDVPIARTGVMMYQPGEVPVAPPKRPGAAQVLYVTRDRATLFAPESLGSVVGAPITLDHPLVDVSPENWNQLAGGFVLDAWQGEGDEADLMFADIVVTDKGLIHKVNTDQLREVSLGYTADYEQTGDGEGRQRNIVINHLALVERGRCGPRCAIGDRQTLEGEDMPRTTDGTQAPGGARPRNRLDALRAEIDALEQDEQEDGIQVHVHLPASATPATPARTADGEPPARTLDAATEERIGSIEEGMLELRTEFTTGLQRIEALLQGRTTDGGGTPPPPADGDSAALATSYQQMLSQAEILVPGYRAATFDSALPRAKTVDAMCATRRAVLTQLVANAEGRALVGQVTDAGFDVAGSDCASVSTVFKAAAALKASANNRATTGDRLTVPGGGAIQPVIGMGGMKPMTADQINEQNAKFWSNQ